MNNDTHASRCIKSITVTKDRDLRRCDETLTVSVELNQRCDLHVALRSDPFMHHNMSAAQARDYAEYRRRDLSRRLADVFTREIEDAVGRLEAAVLVGETVTLRRV